MYNKTNADKVREMMKAFGQEVKTSPSLVDKATSDLRVELIDEEFKELLDAIQDDNIIEIADAITDLLVVTYGAAHAYGIPIDDCFQEVHTSNMSKLDNNGNVILREDGKILKGPNYTPPNLTNILKV